MTTTTDALLAELADADRDVIALLHLPAADPTYRAARDRGWNACQALRATGTTPPPVALP